MCDVSRRKKPVPKVNLSARLPTPASLSISCVTRLTIVAIIRTKIERAVMYVFLTITFLICSYDEVFEFILANSFFFQSELVVRLADGPDPLSGRIELRKNGVWGTICDDDFGPEEAAVSFSLLLVHPAILISLLVESGHLPNDGLERAGSSS